MSPLARVSAPGVPQRSRHPLHLRLVRADDDLYPLVDEDAEVDDEVMTWTGSIAMYSSWLGAAGRSPGTVRLHRHYLSNMTSLAPTPRSVTRSALLSFLANPAWKPETRKSARSVAVGFFGWARREGLIDEDPSRGLPPVSVPPPVAKPAPEHVLAEALEGAAPRVRTMLLLAAYAGLRCSEISRVHRDDYSDGVLYVVGKGGRQRIVPITHPELDFALRRADAWLFPNGRGSHLSPGHVTRLLSEALPGEWTGHKLRHRFATRSYQTNPDVLALGQVLGHSRPETTMRYVQVSRDALLAVVRGAH